MALCLDMFVYSSYLTLVLNRRENQELRRRLQVTVSHHKAQIKAARSQRDFVNSNMVTLVDPSLLEKMEEEKRRKREEIAEAMIKQKEREEERYLPWHLIFLPIRVNLDGGNR